MPYAHTRDLVDYAPLLAVLVAIGVGLMQWYVQRKQQRQQLFDRRFQVYLDVRKFLSRALDKKGQPLDINDYEEFFNNMRPARFLFGSDVMAFIDQIHSDISHEEDKDCNDILRVGWEDDDPFLIHIKWGVNAEKVFRPYLYIHHDGWWITRLMRRLNRWVNEDQPKTMATRYEN